MKSKRETACEKPHDWTTEEIKVLRGNARLGARVLVDIINANRAIERPHIAPLTLSAVYCKAHELGVSLRRPRSRAGRRMGIPRSMRIGDLGDVATKVLAGAVDTAQAEKIVAAEARGELPLCPTCGRRPATMRRTGLCVVCHKARLIEALNEQLAAHEAQKEQWAAQQRLSRARRSASQA